MSSDGRKRRVAVVCDFCNRPIASVHAETQLGIVACDSCLAGPRGKSSEAEWIERKFVAAGRQKRGIRVESIEDVLARAGSVVVREQVDHAQQALDHARSLYRQGEPFAAMEALQAAWNMAQSLFNVLANRPEIVTGKKLRTKSAEGNAIRKKEARARHDDWQRRANSKWAESLHASKAASEIAKLIAKAGENPNTIRRAIKPPR